MKLQFSEQLFPWIGLISWCLSLLSSWPIVVMSCHVAVPSSTTLAWRPCAARAVCPLKTRWAVLGSLWSDRSILLQTMLPKRQLKLKWFVNANVSRHQTRISTFRPKDHSKLLTNCSIRHQGFANCKPQHMHPKTNLHTKHEHTYIQQSNVKWMKNKH